MGEVQSGWERRQDGDAVGGGYYEGLMVVSPEMKFSGLTLCDGGLNERLTKLGGDRYSVSSYHVCVFISQFRFDGYLRVMYVFSS